MNEGYLDRVRKEVKLLHIDDLLKGVAIGEGKVLVTSGDVPFSEILEMPPDLAEDYKEGKFHVSVKCAGDCE